MGRFNRKMTAEKIEKWIKEGRGQGRGMEYKSWLGVQDVSSEGNSHRFNGKIVPRQYDEFSGNEEKYHKGIEIAHFALKKKFVTDIREQYPLLPLTETLEIASALGIEHPPKTSSEKIVLTTDFVITILEGSDSIDIARTFKETKDLTMRNLEKFEIERVYWERRGIDWGIITELDVSKFFLENARLLWNYILAQDTKLTEEKIGLIAKALSEKVMTTKLPLNKFCLAVDKQLKLEKRGTSLRVARHLIARGYWQIDWFRPFSTTEHLTVFSVKAYP